MRITWDRDDDADPVRVASVVRFGHLVSVVVLDDVAPRLGFKSGGVGGTVLAILFIVTGVWVLRSWMKVVEVERLARVIALNMDEEGGPA